MSLEVQADVQISVAKYNLIVTKDRVRELRMARLRPNAVTVGPHEVDAERVISVGQP